MPETLDRCVSHVMDQGHSESSAYAICRASLDLKTDGTEDDKPIDISDEDMKSRLSVALQFRNEPTLIKDVVLCGPMGKFVNGEQKGVMDRKRLSGIAARFGGRNVPVFLEGEHPENNDEAEPVGWVESVRMEGDNLMGRLKLYGRGALAVGGDRVRNGSIYTVRGKNYQGDDIGEILKHYLLNNEGFYKETNIAATHIKGEPLVACFTTALKMEADDMADDVKTLKDENAALKSEVAALKARSADEKLSAELTESKALLAEKTREVVELTAANENLKADVEKFKSPKAMEEMQAQLTEMRRQNKAEKIRRLVAQGVEAGQFDRALVGDPETGYRHPSDEMVLSWFKASAFRDSMERLGIMLETMPKKRLNRTFGNGPGVDGEVAYTDSQKDTIRRLGHDPEKVGAALKATDVKDYAANAK